MSDVSTGTTTDRTGRSQEHRKRDQALVALHKAGDARAFGRLYDLWFDPVYDRIIHRGVRPRDAAAVETEAFTTVTQDLGQSAANESFAVVALRATRRAAGQAGGGTPHPGPQAVGAEGRLAAATNVGAIAADTEVAALCWQAADVLGERVRESLDLHYRFGLSSREVAAVLRERPEAIAELLPKLPLGFGNAVRARVLWRGGSPEHDVLRGELVGHDRFDADTVRIVSRHLKTCDQCRARALIALPPVEVFAAIPIAGAPVGLKEQVASGLAASTPMTGSAYLRPADRAAATTASAATPKPTISSPTTARQTRKRGAAALLAAGAAGAGAVGAAAATAPTSGAVTGRQPTLPPPPEAAPTPTPNPTPTPVGDDAGATVVAATVAGTTVTGAPAAPPADLTAKNAPMHEPVKAAEKKAGADVIGGGRRRLVIAGGVAAALALVLGIVVLTRDGGNTEISTASGPETTTTEQPTTTTRPAVTTSTIPLPTTTLPVTPTSPVTSAPAVNPAPPPSGGGGGGGSAAAPTTPTTQAPLNLSISFALTPNFIFPSGESTLVWDISASRFVRVAINGPNGFYAETLSGSAQVCPGTPGCSESGTQLAYSLEVYDGDRLVGQRSILLTVR